MDDLIAFVRARLDEAAAGAWSVHDVAKCDALLYEEGMSAAAADTPDCDCGHPARVRREVAAIREIVNAYVLAKRRYDSRVTMRDLAEDRHQAGTVFGLLCAVQCIGVIWESHPDYRPEWKP